MQSAKLGVCETGGQETQFQQKKMFKEEKEFGQLHVLTLPEI